ncbi:acylphosphatase [Actinomadura litoris]|uniref:acylphosphatase n=1 Tax=Actinomadura litoris TaxID=2678616 RepID=UPI001FA7FEE7|nr:acylphosphatase [Actinomadura litoris]
MDERHDETETETEAVRLTAWVRGRVQGVGFRWWVRARALELGLAGSATNLRDGRVEVVAEGPRPACQRLLDLLSADMSAEAAAGTPPAPVVSRDRPLRPGRVSGVTERWSAARGGVAGFQER